jgi:uncharacterized protein YjeT (DUF2065 family)
MESEMKTAIAMMAVLYGLSEVWYFGFKEGWRQSAEAAAASKHPAEAEAAPALPPVVDTGGSYSVRL